MVDDARSNPQPRRRHKAVSKIPFTTVSSDEKLISQKTKIHLYGVVNALCVALLVIFLCFAIYSCDNFLPKSKEKDSPSNEFSGDRARKYLTGLTNIGPRVSGSYENDVVAVKYLVKQLNTIKNNAKKGYHIEIDVQTSSGSFAFVRESRYVDLGFISAYDNITNVVVKLSSNSKEKIFVMLNVHYDTVMNTQGGSDDGVSCAVLLEIFRALSQSDPSKLKHGVMFLFNGAEEGGLAGSHGFIAHHKWVSDVQAVINVEAAGSGGREFVFQTGPEHPWIIGAYASSAKYPYASVVAQEIFNSGIIPSDTDFRVFVEYGKLVGIDIAFVSNGYIYHTRYDDGKTIPDGSIQRAGDNIHALTVNMANSPYIENPSLYKHGNSVFFDLLGVFVIHYPKRLHILMNYITLFTILLYVIHKLIQKKAAAPNDDLVSLSSLIMSVSCILSSWLSAILFPMALALFMVKTGNLMTWYSYPFFGLLLYGLPSLLGLLFAHYVGHQLSKKVGVPGIKSFILAHLLIDCGILVFLNHYELLSSYILWLWIVSPFLFLCIPLDVIPFLPEKSDLATFLLHLFCIIPPSVITMYHINVLFNFFVPILGRSGTEIPGEYVVAMLSAISVIVILTFMMNIYQKTANKHKYLIFLSILSLLTTGYAISGRLHPYSASNPTTPKRLFMVHTLRTFHDGDGGIRKTDSGIWLQPMDYLGFKPLKNIPFYKDTEKFECDGSYCGLPYYYAMRKVIKQQWYLRGEAPDVGESPLPSNVYTRTEVSADAVRYDFDIKGPDHMNLFLTLTNESVLSDWSFYKGDVRKFYEMSDNNGGNAHIIFYSHGYYSNSWKFWIELKKTSVGDTTKLAELGIARHHLQGPKARSSFLKKSLKQLPPWICDNAWIAYYDSFLLK